MSALDHKQTFAKQGRRTAECGLERNRSVRGVV